MTEKSKSLIQWSMWVGGLAVLSFILSVAVFYGDAMIMRLDHKDFYFGGMGLLACIAFLAAVFFSYWKR